MSRDRLAAIAATIGVVAVLLLGLFALGGPGKQRLIQSDLRTVRVLWGLSQQIQFAFRGAGNVLPTNLEQFAVPLKQNPVINQPSAYHPQSNGKYELCAKFATNSRLYETKNINDSWTHPKGDYCFQLDASQQVPPAPFYF